MKYIFCYVQNSIFYIILYLVSILYKLLELDIKIIKIILTI